MTQAFEDLFPMGGGGGAPYVSGKFYPATEMGALGTSSTANEDWLLPFSPRKTVAISEVGWDRKGTTAANVYVGIYDASGALLTDCAVDADTTVGLHSVPTTSVTLIPSELYYFAWNASADVAQLVGLGGTGSGFDAYNQAFLRGVHVDIASSVNKASVSYSKSRSNAPLLSSLTLSSWVGETQAVYMGFVVA